MLTPESNSSDLFSDQIKLINDSISNIHSKYIGFNIRKLININDILFNLGKRVDELQGVIYELNLNEADQAALSNISTRINSELNKGSGLIHKIQKLFYRALIKEIENKISKMQINVPTQKTTQISALVFKWVDQGKIEQASALIHRIKDEETRNKCYSCLIKKGKLQEDSILQEHQESFKKYFKENGYNSSPTQQTAAPSGFIRQIRKAAAQSTGFHHFFSGPPKKPNNTEQTTSYSISSSKETSPSTQQSTSEEVKKSSSLEITPESSLKEMGNLLERSMGKDLSDVVLSLLGKDGLSSFTQEGDLFHFTLQNPIQKEIPKSTIKSLLPNGNISMSVKFPETISIEINKKENFISFLNPNKTIWFHNIKGNDLMTRSALIGRPTSFGLQKIAIDKESKKGAIKLFLTNFSENTWGKEEIHPRLNERSFASFWEAMTSHKQ